MNSILKHALVAATLGISAQAMAQVTFYEREGFQGRSFTADRQVRNFERSGFNDRASSVVVRAERGERWEVCEDVRFSGRCVVLRPGNYPSLAAMGLNNQVSSVRQISRNVAIDENRYAPFPVAAYDARRRANERLFEARVTSVRAVVGPPEQRCWVEREAVAPSGGGANVPGAVLGAVIGGVLGHQIGGGRGRLSRPRARRSGGFGLGRLAAGAGAQLAEPAARSPRAGASGRWDRAALARSSAAACRSGGGRAGGWLDKAGCPGASGPAHSRCTGCGCRVGLGPALASASASGAMVHAGVTARLAGGSAGADGGRAAGLDSVRAAVDQAEFAAAPFAAAPLARADVVQAAGPNAWPLCRRLASYMAASAQASRCSGVDPWSGQRAMPMLGRTSNIRRSSVRGAAIALNNLVAIRLRCSRSRNAVSRQPNSSPPSRATVSPTRTARDIRAAMIFSTSSPTACPC